MKNVLIVDSSLHGAAGNSSQLTAHVKSLLEGKAQITHIDLSQDDNAHLTGAEMGTWMTDPAERSEAQAALAKVSDTYVAQVQAADTIVLGVPMYNFGVPSALKAWIDRIARAGVTFKYTDTGPVGLLSDKKIIVAAARGGMYAGTPADTQTPYLTSFFNFLGLTDIEFVYAEGLVMGDADTPMNAAKEKLATLVN
jgi:FMN-dependent NADH-azoreductase